MTEPGFSRGVSAANTSAPLPCDLISEQVICTDNYRHLTEQETEAGKIVGLASGSSLSRLRSWDRTPRCPRWATGTQMWWEGRGGSWVLRRQVGAEILEPLAAKSGEDVTEASAAPGHFFLLGSQLDHVSQPRCARVGPWAGVFCSAECEGRRSGSALDWHTRELVCVSSAVSWRDAEDLGEDRRPWGQAEPLHGENLGPRPSKGQWFPKHWPDSGHESQQ